MFSPRGPQFDIFVFEKLNEEDKSWTNKYVIVCDAPFGWGHGVSCSGSQCGAPGRFELWHAGLAKAVKRRKTKLDTGAWYQQGMQSVGTVRGFFFFLPMGLALSTLTPFLGY